MAKFSLKNLGPNKTIHMIGIGGISMSAIADILLYLGHSVTGSDMTFSPLLKKLEDKGAKIYIGQRAENIETPDLVCYTAAIKEDNPELIKARTLGVSCVERAELLGGILEYYKYPLAVAGTHGKTTTTSMLSLILLAANVDPTILVGGELEQINGNFKIGGEDYLVFEACEYVESFLNFNPFLSIITNIEEDHLDYFVNLSHIITSFEKFARLNSTNGSIIVCSDDKNIPSVVQNIETKVYKYAIYDKNADFVAENIRETDDGCLEYDIFKDKKHFMTITLNVLGKHNIYNSLGAALAAHSLGIEPRYIREGLLAFKGTKRRFEELGRVQGALVVDDYAHHPTEIKMTLEAARNLKPKNLWCVFQPHTYTRTKAFLNEFAEALSLADKVVLADIYAAREKNDGTIHSKDIAKLVPNSTYISDFEEIEKYLKENIEEGDIVITMGAGNINTVGKNLVSDCK